MSVISLHQVSADKLLDQAVKIFQDLYKRDPEVATYAPGRVNLIGEHTDYNDGFVFPLALPFQTIVVGGKSSLPSSRFYSCNVNSTENMVKFTIDESLSKGKPTWCNYVKGTIYQYLQDLPQYFAVDAVVISNVPIGSGLSSSASLEVAVATFLEKLCNLNISGVEKALRCQKAEHTFADTPCGIMDQYISAMGKKDNVLLIDCRSREYQLVALQPDKVTKELPVILVSNSNVKHSLSGSEYPERVQQCKEAVKLIQSKYPAVTALRDVTIDMLDEFREQLGDLVYKRASHSVTEDARTLATVKSIADGDYESVGKYMYGSHCSLRDNYEVSCPEVDVLVELAMSFPGVYGSRMTGGGFGGCTVTLVKKSQVTALIEHLKSNYPLKTSLECDCYEALPCEGANSIDITKVVNKPVKSSSWSNYSLIAPVSLGIAAVGIAACYFYNK